MFKRLRIVLLVLAGIAAGWLVRALIAPSAPAPEQQAAAGDGAASEEQASEWTCAMHPQVRNPGPGLCPICGMDLIPVVEDEGGELDPRTLRMSEHGAALARVRTTAVQRRAVAHELSMVGRISYDETRLAELAAWMPGRLERLYVDYTGVTVREGDHMVDIYSPELYATQEALLQFTRSAERLAQSPVEELRDATQASAESARTKLELLGLSAEQINAVIERGTPSERMTLHAPIGGVVIHKNAIEGMYVDEGDTLYRIADLSKVWLELDAYESDLPWLRYGQDVAFRVEAHPGEEFHGRIAFIQPEFSANARTVQVRVNVENGDRRLKPGMFARARVEAVLTGGGQVVDPALAGKWMCPMHPEVIADDPGACGECGMPLAPVEELGFRTAEPVDSPLVIPVSAPLITGKRAIVYVRVPDADQPTFQGREIVLGPRAGDWYVVEEGLEEGEEVVTRGAFKIDAELQLLAKASMMLPPEAGTGGTDADQEEGEPRVRADVPAPFRRQLGNLLRASLPLGEALAADDLAAAHATIEDLRAAHGAWDVRAAGAQHEDHAVATAAKVGAAIEGVAEAGNLEAARARFEELQVALIAAAGDFGYRSEEGGVAVFHCPMAFDNRGADWLQPAGSATENPYFGARMFRCGEQTRVLEPVAPGGDGDGESGDQEDGE